jgi:hypothetical protein
MLFNYGCSQRISAKNFAILCGKTSLNAENCKEKRKEPKRKKS